MRQDAGGGWIKAVCDLCGRVTDPGPKKYRVEIDRRARLHGWTIFDIPTTVVGEIARVHVCPACLPYVKDALTK